MPGSYFLGVPYQGRDGLDPGLRTHPDKPDKANKSVGIVLFKRLVIHKCTSENPKGGCKKNPKTGEMPTVAEVYKAGLARLLRQVQGGQCHLPSHFGPHCETHR